VNDLTKKEQEKLIQFAKFFQNYNPLFRMAPGMALQFEQLRKEVLPIVDKAYSVENG
jgi:hypothetical protein